MDKLFLALMIFIKINTTIKQLMSTLIVTIEGIIVIVLNPLLIN